MAAVYRRALDTPIGRLVLYGTEQALLAIALPAQELQGLERRLLRAGEAIFENQCSLKEPARQLTEYFEGRRKAFDLEVELRGTAFQRSVWQAVAAVSYGRTRSYAGIADDIGRPSAIRATGAANGANPLPIVIPCHRIIGSNGSLTGYGGGLDLKQQLLTLEGATIGQQRA